MLRVSLSRFTYTYEGVEVFVSFQAETRNDAMKYNKSEHSEFMLNHVLSFFGSVHESASYAFLGSWSYALAHRELPLVTFTSKFIFSIIAIEINKQFYLYISENIVTLWTT